MSTTTVTTGTETPVRQPGRWRRHWPWALLAVVLCLGALVLILRAGNETNKRTNDPLGVGPTGAGALAAVLSDHGVDVHRTESWTEAKDQLRSGTTVFVTRTSFLPNQVLTELLTSGAHVVLLNPGEELDQMTDQADPDGFLAADSVAAGCSVPEAARAGTIRADVLQYKTSGSATSCFQGGYVTVRPLDRLGSNEFQILGAEQVIQNASIEQAGNAALAIGALGRDQDLVWWMPSPFDPAFSNSDAPVDPLSLLPRWVGPAAWLLLLSVLPLALWRGRRLGRLVPEPLPVVVRSVETAEGRATLYRRAGESRRALQVLRAAALHRSASRLGLPAGAEPPAVIDAIAQATSRPAEELNALLLAEPGPNPVLHDYVSRIDEVEAALRSEPNPNPDAPNHKES